MVVMGRDAEIVVVASGSIVFTDGDGGSSEDV